MRWRCRLKHCSRCGELKPRSEFRRDITQHDGLDSLCKVCRKGSGRESRHRAHARYHAKQRRERILQAVNNFTPEQREMLLAKSKGLCAYCGRPSTDLVIDHIIPISQRGGHTLENLTVACKGCNSRKGGRTPKQAGMYDRLGISYQQRWQEAGDRVRAVFAHVPKLLSLEFGLPSSEISNRLYRRWRENNSVGDTLGGWLSYLRAIEAELHGWPSKYGDAFFHDTWRPRRTLCRLDIELLEDLVNAYEAVEPVVSQHSE